PAGDLTGTSHRLYLCGSGGRAGPGWHPDSAGAVCAVDHARAMDRRACAKHLWPRDGRRADADFIRLCLRKYWYGEWYSAGCWRPAPAGELRRLGTDRVDGRVWYRDVDPYPQKNVVKKRIKIRGSE